MDINKIFPEGLKVRVRTGDKSDKGSHIVQDIAVKPQNWSNAFMALVIESGARAIIAEKANNVPTEGGAKRDWAVATFKEADAGEMPKGIVVRVPGAGAAPAYPLNELAAINARLAKWNAQLSAMAEGTGKGGRVTDSDRANAARQVPALAGLIAGEGDKARFDVAKVHAWIKENDPKAFGESDADFVL